MRAVRARAILRWSPRVIATALACLAGSLALDATREGAAALAVHAVPALIIVAIVVVAWRYELVGAIAFAALGTSYGFMAWRHLDWLMVIDGPLLSAALLYAASWYVERNAPAPKWRLAPHHERQRQERGPDRD